MKFNWQKQNGLKYSKNGKSSTLPRMVKKVKASMAKSLPVENLLPQNVGSIINYLE